MQLLKLTELTPKRNDKYEVIGWDEKELLINPHHLQGVSWEHVNKKVIVCLTRGTEFLVKESFDGINSRFELATAGFVTATSND